MRKKNGITLIALVITIVVLLILAGVSINLIAGENGIVTKAKQVAEKTEEANAVEIMSEYLAGVQISNYHEKDFRLADYLSSNIGNDGIEDFLNNGDGTAQVAYKGHNFLVNLLDYTFTYLGPNNGNGISRYIRQVLNNNNQDVPGIAMVEAGELETEDLGWKVLSVNIDGTVNLIANTNTGFEVSLTGINGYTNGVKAFNEICSKLYGNLEVNGVKVLSARNANLEDFYDVTYKVQRIYENNKKIQPYINTLDVANNGYSKEQISDYIDVSNTSANQANNTQMLLANTSPTIKIIDKVTKKSTYNMMSTRTKYWLATRITSSSWNSQNGTVPYSEDISNEAYSMNFADINGNYSSYSLFGVSKYNTSGSNFVTQSCALRPVITVAGDSVLDKTIGASVSTEPFYKGKTGTEAHGYVKADSIASLLNLDIQSINKISSGLPIIETDMTWTKLEDGGYDSLTEKFDTSKYDYYIADKATSLQIRLTGAAGYNNGVLAIDTVCNSIYGNLTEIKLSNGKTKKVKVVFARNAKFEDFVDDSKINNDTYGGLWTTNVNDDTVSNKINAINSRWAPTVFTQYENIDPTQGASKGYSDAKIGSYILSDVGINSFVSNDQKNSYAYEKYNENPGLKVIYNAYSGNANRNTANVNVGKEYWLSSRCVDAYLNGVRFYLRSVSGDSVMKRGMFHSSTSTNSFGCGIRPVLQVEQ